MICDMVVRTFQVYGNNAEIQALSEMYNRPIHIYSYSTGTLLFEKNYCDINSIKDKQV